MPPPPVSPSGPVDLRGLVRSIPDFPQPGIVFRDVTTLFADPVGWRTTIDRLADHFADLAIDQVAGIEARGFLLAGALADRLGAGVMSIRKRGKLPADTIARSYDLEYGSAEVEVHTDAARPGEHVLVVDDLLATGGTAEAAALLVRQLGARLVHCGFVVELPDLGGRERLEQLDLDVHALVTFAGT
jgi:adenine phosphoribosyltransferase